MQAPAYTTNPDRQFDDDIERMRRLGRPSWPSSRLLAAFVGYQVLALAALPFVFLRFILLSRREPEYRRHVLHRLGLGPVASGNCVWIFAASLGETRAASPVVRHCLEQDYSVCLTCNTPAGLQEARNLFADEDANVVARYAPLDFLPFVLLFMLRQRPLIGLVVEGELWPCYLTVAWLMGKPMAKINGNLIEKSIDHYTRTALGRVRYEFMHLYHAILTKTSAYRERYLRAGVRSERIFCVGELKFDQWVSEAQISAARALKATWAPDTPVFTIASTIEEEESELLSLVERLIAHPAGPKIIWVPRSPQRFDEVSRKLGRLCPSVRRSHVLDAQLRGSIPASARALVGDSLGEMNFYLAPADLVFIGATIAPRGGHNIVEPLALKKPVVVGPSVHGIVYPALIARDHGAIYIATGMDDLTDRVIDLLSDQEELAEFTDRTRDFSSAHLGASWRTFRLVEAALDAWQDGDARSP